MNQRTSFDQRVQRLQASWRGLADKPEETVASTVRTLWFLALGEARSNEAAQSGDLPALIPEAAARLDQLLAQRLAGTPLAHLTGRQRFMGLDFLAGPEALVPRKETEILGQTASTLLKQLAAERGSAQMIDLCTGSGNLALALAYREPAARVFAADVSPAAIALARRNAAHLCLSERVEFREGDLFAPFESDSFRERTDLVVCNPPYISTARVDAMPEEISRFEPRLAFNGGAFGLDILNRLVKDAPRFLKPASWLCFEVGRGQGPYLARFLEKMPEYSCVQSSADTNGDVRALAARTQPG
jgi:release factor glutamine methyltransferase